MRPYPYTVYSPWYAKGKLANKKKIQKTGIVAGHNHNNYFVAQNIGVISKRKERFYGSLIEKLQPCSGGAEMAEMAVNSFE